MVHYKLSNTWRNGYIVNYMTDGEMDEKHLNIAFLGVKHVIH
jgi:hypothetical protein